MKNVFRRFLNLSGILSTALLVVLTLSCEIGLGAAVDTEPPSITIDYPKADDVIRNAFRIGGTWSDDGTIQSVKVTLKRTDNDLIINEDNPFEAELTQGNTEADINAVNTWQCVIDPLNPEFPITDGSYVATIAIRDEGEHETIQTVLFTIDNTAPIIVLQRPSSKPDSAPDSYGQKFTLEGQAADDNNVSKITVKFYKDEECTQLLHTVDLNNVPPTISQDVATFKDGEETDYSKIYGSTVKDGTKNFYCRIEAYDDAIYYPLDNPDPTYCISSGNVTTTYYLYEDIATSVLSNHKITEIYHMMNGTYQDGTSARSAVVSDVNNTLTKNVVTTGLFSLNPANNPTFTVSGKELEKDKNCFEDANYSISNGASVVIEVATGLDSIPLDRESLKVYGQLCDTNGNPLPDSVKIYPSNSTGTKNGSSQKFVAKISTKDGFVIGKNYIFGVEGTDESKNEVVPNENAYGFHMASSGAAPTVNVTSPSSNISYLRKGQELIISGTVSCEEGYPSLSIYKNEDQTAIYAITFTESDLIETTSLGKKYSFQYKVPAGAGGFDQTASAQYAYTIQGTQEGLTTNVNKTVLYDIDGPSIDVTSMLPTASKYIGENGTTDGKDYLNGDVKLKLAVIDDYDTVDVTTNKPYFEFLDNSGNAVAFKVDSETEAKTKHYITNPTKQEFTIHTNDIASAADGSDAKTVKLRIYAWDRSGNSYAEKDVLGNIVQQYFEREYTIDQSTDNPVILPNSPSSLTFTYTTKEALEADGGVKSSMGQGSQMYLKLIDDDGLSQLLFYKKKYDPLGDIWSATPDSVPVSGQDIQQPVIVPNEAGYWMCGLKVLDTNTPAKETKVGPFVIRVTSPAPTIARIEVSPTHATTNTMNVDAPQTKFENTVTISSTEGPFKVFRKAGTMFTEAEIANIKRDKESDAHCVSHPDESNTTFTEEITPNVGDPTKYYYLVLDKNGNESNYNLYADCQIDTARPEVVLNAVPSKNETKEEVPSYTFAGTASDETNGSGIRKVVLTISDGTNSKQVEAIGTTNWQTTINYTDTEWNDIFGTASDRKQGIKYVKVEAVDNAGNVSNKFALKSNTTPYPETVTFDDSAAPGVAKPASNWLSFIYDTKDPETTIEGIQELLPKDGFEIKGKATDSYKLKKIEVYRKVPGEPDKESTPCYVQDNLDTQADPKKFEWSTTITPKTDASQPGGVVNGEYVFYVYVYDLAGNSVLAKTIKTTVDTTPPTVSFDNLIKNKTGRNALTESNVRFSGSFVETNLSAVYYQILPADTAPATVTTKTAIPAASDRLNAEKWVGTNEAPLNWKQATPGTTSWNFYQEFYAGNAAPVVSNGELREGSYKLYVYAVDKAANISDGDSSKTGNQPYVLDFDVDMSNPVVNESFAAATGSNFNSDGSTVYFYGTLEITASATDTNGVDATKPLTVTLGGVEKTLAGGKYTVTESDFASQNTAKELKFTAKDIAGKTTDKTYSVIWDKTAPEVSVTTPDTDLSGETSITTAEYTFRGTVKDAGVGIEGNKYKYTFTKTPVAAETLAGIKTASATWTEFTGQSFSTAKNDLTEGNWILYIYAEDKLGLGSFAKRTFSVDNARPAVALSTQPAATNYVNAVTKTTDGGVKFQGTITESNELVSFKIKRGDTEIKSFDIVASAAAGKIVKKPSAAAWSFTDTTAPDGEYTYSFVATDIAGRTNVTTQKVVVVDTVAPSGTTTISSPTTPAYTAGSKDFYNNSQVTLKVTPSDTTPSSGIAKVYYTTTALPSASPSWIEMDNRTTYFDKSITGLGDGKHTVYFKIEDVAGNTNIVTSAGNESSTISKIFNVDTTAPDTVTISGATVGGIAQDLSQSILINGRNDIVLTFTASDANAADTEKSTGVASVTLNKIGSKTPVTANTATVSSGTWTLTITKDNLSTGNIVLTATDNAGNSSDITTTVSISVDDVPPSVSNVKPVNFIDDTAEIYTVNKNIKIGGKSSDNNLASVDLVYWDHKAATPAWKNIFHSTSANSDWETAVIDTTTLTDGETYTFVVIAIDKAGNCNLDTGTGASAVSNHKLESGKYYPDYATLTAFNAVASNASSSMKIKVDQDTDRPQIKLTNMTLYNGADPDATGVIMTKTNTIKMSSSSIIGQVSDDDGLGGLTLTYCVADEEKASFVASDWKAPKSFSSGTWTIEIPEDGVKKLYFKITDAEGAEFTSEFGDAYNAATPVITDGSKTFGKKTSPDSTLTALNITIDTKNPYVEAPEYKRPAIVDKNFEGDKNWSSALSSQSFGGYKNQFNIRQYAYDSNGIVSVTASLEERETDTTASGFSYSRDLAITYKAGGSIPVTQEIAGYTYTEWATTTPFSTQGLVSGPRELKILVFDGTRTTETTKTINIDNEAPGLSVESHEKNAQVGTDFVLKGNLTDGDLGSSIRYVINTTATDIDKDDAIWTSDTTSTELNGVTALTWRLYFTQGSGVMVNAEGYTADLKPKHYVAKLKSTDCEVNADGTCVWKAGSPNIGTATAGDPYTDIVQAYIHFRQEDSLGNAGIWKFPIKIDPQGEIPSITMTYPGEAADGTLTASLSGIIRTQGAAYDDKNIAGLYMQIDPDYNGTFAANWDTKACASYSAAAGGNPATGYATLTAAGYTIENLYNKFNALPENAANQKTTDKKGIYIGKGTSWSFAINTKGEFNGAGGQNKKIAIRLYAVDTDGNISMPKAEEDFVITIDASLPQIGSSEQLYLYKGANKTGASMEYKEGMWLSGKWYLTGSVEDASGITEATVGDTNLLTGKTEKNFTTAGTKGYSFEVQIGSDTANTYGKLEYRIAVKDGTDQQNFKDIVVNYDNKNPILEGSADDFYNLVKNNKIANSSGFYTLGSAAYEASGESGYKRTAFYFKRTITGKEAIYDTYLSKKNGADEAYNKYKYTGASPDVTIDATDFLPWLPSVSVSSVSGRELTLAAAPGKSVHKGGLAKVNGTIYTIADITGSVITLDGSPDESASAIQFAIANVVDHSGAESVGKVKNNTTSSYGYGYYTDSMDDDGDMMIETVSTSGTQTIWSATINSRNIPDGAVELHYVVFDKAGNCTHESKNVTVENNAPRLASVKISTDYDGDGVFAGEDEVYTAYYSRKSLIFNTGNRYGSRDAGSELIASGNNKDKTNGGTPVMTVFSSVQFEPEIIGGNGNLYYTYKIDGQGNVTQEKAGASNKLSLTKADGTTQVTGYDDREEDYMKEDDEYNSYVVGHSDGVILYKDTDTPADRHTMDKLNNGNTWFNYTIWDSTEGLTAGTDSLHATMSICLNVKYNDQTPPKAGIRPFYWNSKTDNSVAWVTSGSTSEAAGHIELEDDLTSQIMTDFGDTATAKDPKVSGKVKFEGYAYDDVRVKELYVEMSDHAGISSSTKVAEYGTSWTYVNGTGYEVSCVNLYCNSNGHLVKWTVTVDTCNVASGKETVGKDRIFKVVAKDKASNSSTAGNTQTVISTANKSTWGTVKTLANATKEYFTDVYGTVTVAQAETNAATMGTASVTDDTVVYKGFNPATSGNMGMTSYYKVDVVPYIKKIESRLGTNNRSSNGHYQIGADETTAGTVKVNGFNLAENNGTVDISANMGSQATGAYVLTVGTTAQIQTINNKNDDTKPYNSQANSTVSSMTDNIYLDMWQINSRAAQTNSGISLITSPAMDYNPVTGHIGFAFADGANFFSMAQGTRSDNGTQYSYRLWEKNYAKYVENVLVYDNRGRSHAISVGQDTYPEIYKAGRMSLYDSYWGLGEVGKDTANFQDHKNSIHLDAIGIGTANIPENRFSSVTMACAEHTVNNTTTPTLYIAYYDLIKDRITFRWGDVQTTSAAQGGNQKRNYGQLVPPDNEPNEAGFELNNRDFSLLAGGSSVNTAGEYVGLAVIPGSTKADDVVCAVWYDGSDLNYSYKINPCNDNDASSDYSSGHWTQTQKLITNGGQYCQIKADANGGIHIAAFDQGNKAIGYIYLPSYNTTYSKSSHYYIIDALNGPYDEIGLDVTVSEVGANGLAYPTISYYANGIPKLASYTAGIKKSTGVPETSWENDAFTGNWDVCFVPTASTLLKDNICIAQPHNTSGIRTNVSGASGSFTSAGNKGEGTVRGNGTTNPILGYAIRSGAVGYLEIAQRK